MLPRTTLVEPRRARVVLRDMPPDAVVETFHTGFSSDSGDHHVTKHDTGNTGSLRGREVRIPSHGHGVLFPFSKGQSGNPGGKGGLFQEITSIARKASPDAVRRIIELMQDEDSRVSLMACMAVLDRAFGKVKDPMVDAKTGNAKLVDRI